MSKEEVTATLDLISSGIRLALTVALFLGGLRIAADPSLPTWQRLIFPIFAVFLITVARHQIAKDFWYFVNSSPWRKRK